MATALVFVNYAPSLDAALWSEPYTPPPLLRCAPAACNERRHTHTHTQTHTHSYPNPNQAFHGWSRYVEVNNGLWVVLLYASYYVLLEPFAGITWLLTHGVGCYAAATALRQVFPARSYLKTLARHPSNQPAGSLN
jgi:hypothetical protein